MKGLAILWDGLSWVGEADIRTKGLLVLWDGLSWVVVSRHNNKRAGNSSGWSLLASSPKKKNRRGDVPACCVPLHKT